MTPTTLAKDYFRTFDPRCPACGDRPSVSVSDVAHTAAVRVRLWCHGSHENRVFSTAPRVSAAEAEAMLDRLHAFTEEAFRADCHPDVMELLRMGKA